MVLCYCNSYLTSQIGPFVVNFRTRVFRLGSCINYSTKARFFTLNFVDNLCHFTVTEFSVPLMFIVELICNFRRLKLDFSI